MAHVSDIMILINYILINKLINKYILFRQRGHRDSDMSYKNIIAIIYNNIINISTTVLRDWITKKYQKFPKKVCKFVTAILFGTMSESFKKIVRIAFELQALVWGWE